MDGKKILSNQDCANALKAMSDETRLQIIQTLSRGEKCGTDLARELDLPQPHIAHHLGILRNAGLVSSIRNGKRVGYRLHPAVAESLQSDQDTHINLGCCKISFRS